MKPKNLKFPFSWEERRPLFANRVLFVPEYYDRHQEFQFPGWDHPDYFGRQGKVFIEYCAGNGAWVVEKALANPQDLWVAVEWRFERIRKIWSKIQNHNISNLIAVCGEALTFSKYYLSSDCIDGAYINFPDPWPKDKHAKNRLLQQPFVDELSRIMKKEGTVFLVTDDPVYTDQICKELLNSPSWKPSFQDPYFVTQWDDYGASYFGDLWLEKGKTIHYIQFENDKS